MKQAKRGRPSKYRNGADRQKAYRARKKWEKERTERFDALRKSPMGWNIGGAFAGDRCVLCGYTIHWIDRNERDYSLEFPEYQHIPLVRLEGCSFTDDDWFLCPECSNGNCEYPIALDPVQKIGWSDYETYLERTGK